LSPTSPLVKQLRLSVDAYNQRRSLGQYVETILTGECSFQGNMGTRLLRGVPLLVFWRSSLMRVLRSSYMFPAKVLCQGWRTSCSKQCSPSVRRPEVTFDKKLFLLSEVTTLPFLKYYRERETVEWGVDFRERNTNYSYNLYKARDFL